SAVTAEDLNHDGKLDLIVAAASGVNTNVLLGNGDGSFTPMPPYRGVVPTWVVVADVSGDGLTDLVTADFGSPRGVSVFQGNGDGTFEAPLYYPAGFSTGFVALGDFNSDGMLDILAPDNLSENVTIFLKTGVLRFVPSTPLHFPPASLGWPKLSFDVEVDQHGQISRDRLVICRHGTIWGCEPLRGDHFCWRNLQL